MGTTRQKIEDHQNDVEELSGKIDKAAATGVMHKNKAARKKSQLAKRLNAGAQG